MIEDDIRRSTRKLINDKLDDYFDDVLRVTEYLNTPTPLGAKPLEVHTADELALRFAVEASLWMSEKFEKQANDNDSLQNQIRSDNRRKTD